MDPLPAAAAVIFVVAFYGNFKLASAIQWKGAVGHLLVPFVVVGTVAMVESVLVFVERLQRALRPIRSRRMSPADPKDALRASVRSAQVRYEEDSEAARQARRDAFAQAQEGGLSLRDIGETVGLHHSRVGQIIEGK